MNKIQGWTLVVITAVFGLIISLPLMYSNLFLEKSICENKPLNTQTDIKGTSLCSKLSEVEIRSTGSRIYCQEGIMYDLYKHESCINNILFFPLFPWAEDLGDSSIVLLYLIPLYGGLIGILVGFIIIVVVKVGKRKILFEKKRKMSL